MKFEQLLMHFPEITNIIKALKIKASECNIERSTIRQLLMALVKKLVAESSIQELAGICAVGENFDPVRFESKE